MRRSTLMMVAVLCLVAGRSVADYSTAVRGGCPSIVAFFNLAPISPCYGHRCTRAQCQADCDRTSTCAGYEFDATDQTIDQPGYCFLLSKTCPVPLTKDGEDYMTRWTYMKLRMSFKDDLPITFRTVNENRIFQIASNTGPRQSTIPPLIHRPKLIWRNSARKSETLKSFGSLEANGKPALSRFSMDSQASGKIVDLPEFVSIRGGCPSPNAFLTMPPNFVCQGQRCHKIDCASACLASSICIGFEFDAWDQTTLSSSGFCWLLQSTCSAKLTSEGEDFATRWTYLKRGDDTIASKGGDDLSLVISIGAAPSAATSDMPEHNFVAAVKEAGEGHYSSHFIEPIGNAGASTNNNNNGGDINVSNQPLVPKMQFVHGWNLQQSYMMSIGGCTSSPEGGSLVYLPMEVPPHADDALNGTHHNVNKTHLHEVSLSVKQCLYHQCTRFDCENTCNMRPDCVGYEFAGASHGLTTVGYCHLLKRPCPADQRSEGAVFLTRLTYLKAE